jgi:2-keto-4-pentenoate hydratase/2-oxohepta-3-ene-1,7-dioic acid hydratase in catechol pathway
MRLATFLAPGADSPASGEVRGEQVVAFADGSTVLERLSSGDRTPADGQPYRLDEVAMLAPHRPRAAFAIGLNYRLHAQEGGAKIPEEPLVFYKGPGSVVPPGGPVRHPTGTEELDYEVEFTIVMGPENGVAGYAVANDISARDWQRSDVQWWRAKAADTFCPFGPWITTADEVSDPYDLAIRCWVNNDLRQDARTNDLIFRADQLIAFISEAVRLEPGDLILTGTPHGVGMAMQPPRFLKPGDVVRMEIEQLGAIEHEIVE